MRLIDEDLMDRRCFIKTSCIALAATLAGCGHLTPQTGETDKAAAYHRSIDPELLSVFAQIMVTGKVIPGARPALGCCCLLYTSPSPRD